MYGVYTSLEKLCYILFILWSPIELFGSPQTDFPFRHNCVICTFVAGHVKVFFHQ